MNDELKNIQTEIQSLPNERLGLFALLSCERLLPNYIFFSEEFEFGNKDILKEAIKLIENILFSKSKIQNKQIKKLIQDIDSVTPFPENFNTILSSSALDSCSVILETLYFLLDSDVKRIIDISTLCTDTVNMYIQERENLDYQGEAFWKRIYSDPLMITELNNQKNILNELKFSPMINFPLLEKLRNFQDNDGKSNVNLR